MDGSPASARWSRFLRWMLATATVVVASVGAFNLVVDPLNVVGAPRVVGFNQVKPYLDHHRELVRWRIAQRHCASAVIFGNSRAEIGFDPLHPAFTHHGLDAINQAIPGTDVTTSLRQLRWMQSAGCMPRVVILGVEFFDFLGGASATPAPDPSRDAPPGLDSKWLTETVFSLNGLGDSFRTLAAQRRADAATLTDRGFNPLRNYEAEVRQSGHYTLFRQRAVENARIWSRKAPRLTTSEAGPSVDAQALDALVSSATAAGSTVHLVIYPYHAEIRMMIERLGLGELFAHWKQEVVRIAERHAGGQGKVQVWDFSALSTQTTEPIPDRRDRATQLRFYWEAGHFKKELGDQILAAVLGDEANTGFGKLLHPQDIDTWVAQDRQAVIDAMAAESPLRDEVDDVLRGAGLR